MPTPATILFVIGSLDVGGTERHLCQLLPRLNKNRYRPVVYCTTRLGELAPNLTAKNIIVIGPPTSIQASRGLPARVLRLGLSMTKLFWTTSRLRPTIAHFFLPAAYVIGAPLALAARVPVRVMSRRSQSNYQYREPKYRLIERHLHPWTTAFVANSSCIRDELCHEPGVRKERVWLIHNGIELAPFSLGRPYGQTRAELGLQPDTFVLVVVANLIPYKAHDVLICALGHTALPENWHLLVVGRDDGIGASLRRLAEGLGIAKNISWLGQRSDVVDLLTASNVGVLCSHEEGFSNALLEGMAAGLPMIVTALGGNTDAIKHEVNGLTVPSNDPIALGQSILRLSQDPALARKLGTQARVDVTERFAWRRCVTRYESLYETLLAARRRPTDLSTGRASGEHACVD